MNCRGKFECRSRQLSRTKWIIKLFFQTCRRSRKQPPNLLSGVLASPQLPPGPGRKHAFVSSPPTVIGPVLLPVKQSPKFSLGLLSSNAPGGGSENGCFCSSCTQFCFASSNFSSSNFVIFFFPDRGPESSLWF